MLRLNFTVRLSPPAEIQALQGDKVHHSGRQVPSPLLELQERGPSDSVVYLLVMYWNFSDFVFLCPLI